MSCKQYFFHTNALNIYIIQDFLLLSYTLDFIAALIQSRIYALRNTKNSIKFNKKPLNFMLIYALE